jgi:hypothetical protein
VDWDGPFVNPITQDVDSFEYWCEVGEVDELWWLMKLEWVARMLCDEKL